MLQMGEALVFRAFEILDRQSDFTEPLMQFKNAAMDRPLRPELRQLSGNLGAVDAVGAVSLPATKCRPGFRRICAASVIERTSPCSVNGSGYESAITDTNPHHSNCPNRSRERPPVACVLVDGAAGMSLLPQAAIYYQPTAWPSFRGSEAER